MNKSTIDYSTLIYQLHIFGENYNFFYYLHTTDNKLSRHHINIYTYENQYLLLLSHLCMLFDKNLPDSIPNTRFAYPEIEKTRKKILKDWDGVKEQVIKINDNIGFLSFQNLDIIRNTYKEFRRMDGKVIEFMGELTKLEANFMINFTNK